MIERMCPFNCFVFEPDVFFLCPTSFLEGIVEKLTTQDFLNAASLPPPIFSRSNSDELVNQSIYNLIKDFRSFNITTWNAEGLCSKDPVRAIVKQNFFKQILNNSVILSLQETHDDGLCLPALLSDFGFKLFNNPGTPVSAGSAILVKNTLHDKAVNVIPHIFVKGWIHAVEFIFCSFRLVVFNVHSSPNIDMPTRIDQLRSIHEFLNAPSSLPTFSSMHGDFNSDTAFEDRFDASSGLLCGAPNDFHRAFLRFFPQMPELFQADYTRHRGDSSSRLDRCYADIPSDIGIRSNTAIFHNEYFFPIAFLIIFL